MHRQETAAITAVQYHGNDLFYSPSSFSQALNLENTDFEGFKQIPNGLASLSLKEHGNLVFLSLSSLDDLIYGCLTSTFTSRMDGSWKGIVSGQDGACVSKEVISVYIFARFAKQSGFDDTLSYAT
ncbi:Uncharacterized protein Rs2_07604 [Raphanus sativus]|nr:Uncharacterized protein Rs2_07604 [Raphanus sativus]